MYRGRAAFGAMEGFVFGRPAADAAVGQIDRFGAAWVHLIVSGTLNRRVSEIRNQIRKMTLGIPREIDDPARIREILLLAAKSFGG